MKMPLLKDLHLRVTSKCNFNCRHCYAADWFNDHASLDWETTLSTITQAQALGCQKVTFTGGEPLLSKVTVPAIKTCLDRGLRVEVETNGVLLDKIIPRLKSYLEKVEFAVSYEGEDMRDPRFINRVRNNIRAIKDAGCDLKIQTVLTEINVDEADAMFDFSKSVGAKNRVFLAHSPNGNAKDLALFTIDRWLELLSYLRAKYSHLIIELPDVISGGTQKKCGWGVHRCEIMPNGDVTSCGPITFNKRDYVAGNVRELPLEIIWNSLHFREIRCLTQTDFQGLCSRCPYWKTCLGACRSISYATEGGLLSAHPFCVAIYKGLERGTLDEAQLSAIPLARGWFEQVSARKTMPEKEEYCEIVERQHLRVY
jgi:radical SAM protein with 4Fe4S-binding SPASM domain